MAMEDSATITSSSLLHSQVHARYVSNLDSQIHAAINPYAEATQRADLNANGLECHQNMGKRLSDFHLATRKAEEAASRRFQASSWLQGMVGPLDLSMEPSEEEFRLCLRNGLSLCKVINTVHPGAVSKVVEYSVPSSPSEGALSVYQHFENVRNFLVAVNDLRLPSFEASDLEQSSLLTGSIAKVVDCILAIKTYHEWKQNGRVGNRKLGVPLKPSFGVSNTTALCTLASSNGNHPRRKWAFPETDCLGGRRTLLPEDGADDKGWRSSDGNCNWSSVAYMDDINPEQYDPDMSDSTSAWIDYIGMKLRDVVHTKSRIDRKASILENPGIVNGQKCRFPESLLNFVKAVLREKDQKQIPILVEFMLRKVMEEFERQISQQEEQRKKLELTLIDALKNDTKPSSISPALAGSEGFKVLSDHLQQIKKLKLASLNTMQEVLHMQSSWKRQMDEFEVHFKKVATFAGGYQKILLENRQLYNQVQDLKGNIRVYCRIKPWSGKEGEQGTIEYIGENGELMVVNPRKQGKDIHKSFNFNKVFGPSASQEEVFLDTQPLIRSVLDGYNVCIFAYGQTGSGKTFTMSGPSGGSEKQWGVNYRALNDLFHISQTRKDVFSYEISVQMVEIYNEQVRDLISSDSPNKKLEIRNSSQHNGMNVPNAIMLHVNCTADVLELMEVGHKNRAVGSTAMNERSSRSHSVLTIHVQGTELSSGSVLRGCLHLVDLAGSERVDKSEATGERLKEAQHINKSLSALGDVISALIQKNSHIPYRNSKLTQLLQDSLGGQAKTLMFVHVNPEPESYGETISTLKFAERVASVELGAARSSKECGEVLELKDQVRSLREALAKKEAEVESLSTQRSLRTSTLEAKFALEKTKLRRSRRCGGAEELESRIPMLLLEETGNTPEESQESYSNKLFVQTPARPPSAGEDQVSYYATSVKQKSWTEKRCSPSPKVSPLDRGSLTPEISLQAMHCRSKIPRKLEARANGRSKSSLESSLTSDSVHSESLLCTPSSSERSAGRKENDCELDRSVSSEKFAFQGSPFDSFPALTSRLSDADLHQKLDGRRSKRYSQYGTEIQRHSDIENHESMTPFGGSDNSQKDTVLPQAARNALKPKKSPFSATQAFQINNLRSPLIQKPRNDRRLSLGGTGSGGPPAQGQRPLRRSLILGAAMAPAMDISIPNRATVGARESLDFCPSPFASENVTLEPNGKLEGGVSRQIPCVQIGVSPRFSKRWL